MVSLGASSKEQQEKPEVDHYGFGAGVIEDQKAHCTPAEKEVLAAYDGLQASSEVVGKEACLLLALQFPVLH